MHRRGSGPCSSSAAGAAGGGYGAAAAAGSRGGEDGDDGGCEVCAHEQDVKEAMVASKLDAISFEYNHLLTSQLDSQRQYFEGLMERQRAELEGRAAAAAAAAEKATGERREASGVAKEAERRRAALERKVVRVGWVGGVRGFGVIICI